MNSLGGGRALIFEQSHSGGGPRWCHLPPLRATAGIIKSDHLRQTHTDTQTHSHTQTNRHTDTQTHKHTDTQTHRHTERHTCRQRERPREWERKKRMRIF